MMKQMRLRARLMRGYLDPARDFDMPLREFGAAMLRPKHLETGKALVERVEETPNYRLVYVKGIPQPCYWPRVYALDDLYRVIAECCYVHDWHYYERPETRVAAGDTVLDCGAAEGFFGLTVLERAGRLALFEPSRTFIESLKKTFEGNANVTVVPAGVGATQDTVLFDEHSIFGQFREGPEAIPTPITTIDAWTQANGWTVNYIKADVEGFELEMLRGAAQTIQLCKPKMAVTVYHPENDWRAIVEWVQTLEPKYQYYVKGIAVKNGVRPMMLHLWTK